MGTLLRYIFLFCVILTNFIITGIVVFLIQSVLYFSIRPFSRNLFMKINQYFTNTIACHIVFLVQWVSNSDIIIYIDKTDLKYLGKEHACIIPNHRYEIDWLFIAAIAEYFNVLGLVMSKVKPKPRMRQSWFCIFGFGLEFRFDFNYVAYFLRIFNTKPYVKKSVQYIPVIGCILHYLGAIFLSRSYEKDKEVIQKKLLKVANAPDPVWMMIYPEGTRYNKTKQKISIAVAQKKDLQILKHHLLPKPKGFLTSLPVFKNNFDALYDITFAVSPTDKTKPTLINLFLGKKVTSHIYIKRIPLKEVPEDDEGATEFLNNMFLRKDILLDSFFNTEDYFVQSNITRTEPFKLPKSYSVLLHTAVCFLFMTVPYWCFIIQCLYVGAFNIILILIIVFCVVLALLIVGIELNSVKADKQR